MPIRNYREGRCGRLPRIDARCARTGGTGISISLRGRWRPQRRALAPLRTALIVGLLASLLLFGIVWSLAHTEAARAAPGGAHDLAARRSEARVPAFNRTLEARVETRTRELSEANRELEAFAYSASRTICAHRCARSMASAACSDDRYAPVARRHRPRLPGARAQRRGAHERIDRALLKLSRVARGDLVPERLDLSRMAGEIIAELRTRPTRIATSTSTSRRRWSPAAIAALVRSLLQNLLGNAWKFTRDREQARIEFGAVRRRRRTFYVRDNGVGFDQAYVDKLFRPFQRLHDEDAVRRRGHRPGDGEAHRRAPRRHDPRRRARRARARCSALRCQSCRREAPADVRLRRSCCAGASRAASRGPSRVPCWLRACRASACPWPARVRP